MTPKETLEYFRARQDSVIEKIREIVDIESPSHDVAQNARVVDWIVNELGNIKVETEVRRIPASGFGEHLLIRAFPGEAKPVLVLGHTDTVHPIGTNKINPTRIEDDKFFGCGIFDMKSGIVLMLEAFKIYAETGARP